MFSKINEFRQKLSFLGHYEAIGEYVFEKIDTGDETWGRTTVTTMDAYKLSNQKIKKNFHNRTTMASVFCD